MVFSNDDLKYFQRLLIHVRKTSTSLSEYESYQELKDFGKVIISLYTQTQKLLEKYPRALEEFNELMPYNVGGGSPLQYASQISILRDFLDSLEHTVATQQSEVTEYIIQPGKSLTSNIFIESILTKANSSIKIIDNYLSDEGIEILEHANNTIDYLILTTSINKHKYEKALESIKTMRKGWKGKIEIKISNTHHDRSIIIDDKSLWVSGPSLDKVGIEKYGFIIQLNDENTIKAFVDIFNSSWANANSA